MIAAGGSGFRSNRGAPVSTAGLTFLVLLILVACLRVAATYSVFSETADEHHFVAEWNGGTAHVQLRDLSIRLWHPSSEREPRALGRREHLTMMPYASPAESFAAGLHTPSSSSWATEVKAGRPGGLRTRPRT